ncbi:MAG: hypothetical protein LC800_16635 [Acidobacteria bacterium]|nr:hypothetical protein [Acidobacteriota bacterium]
MTDRREHNRLLVRHLLLPTIFLTVALLGGLRVEAATRALRFVAPPLVALVLAVMLMGLFVRGRLVELGAWLSGARPAVEVCAHALTLAALFFASAQAFNSVLPEAGLFRLLFSFFFLWTLWQSQFAPAAPRRILRSLAALFGTAFALKHMLLASLDDPEGGWLRRLASALLEGVTQGTLGGQQAFAPATGYVSFFTLALYVAGLALMPAAPGESNRAAELIGSYRRLPAGERERARDLIMREELGRLEAGETETVAADGRRAAADED